MRELRDRVGDEVRTVPAELLLGYEALGALPQNRLGHEPLEVLDGGASRILGKQRHEDREVLLCTARDLVRELRPRILELREIRLGEALCRRMLRLPRALLRRRSGARHLVAVLAPRSLVEPARLPA